jgi:glucokinase
MSLVIGIDIGGTKIAGGLVTSAGQVISHRRIPTDSHLGGEHVLESSLNLASQLLGMADEPVLGIGVGAGGVIDSYRGIVLSASDILPGWAGTDIAGAFKSRFNLPSFADNDVNALAIGELTFGAAKGLESVVFLALGTGVGGAIVIDGKVHHGAHWSGGELGYLILDPSADARGEFGGRSGTLEAYCSGSGLFQTYVILAGPDDTITDGASIGARALADPDSLAAEAVRQTGRYLGLALVSIANMLDPEMIVIGGGLSSLGDLLLDPARELLRERALPGPSKCPIVRASLGDHASIIGSASLALSRAITS